jgi:hypothetical protein
MMERHTHENARQPAAFVSGGGTAGGVMRSVDWAGTPLGPVEDWPESLKTTVGTLLHSRHPMFLWWGADLIQFYNEALGQESDRVRARASGFHQDLVKPVDNAAVEDA